MTQVITFQHNGHTFFVCAEQRDALNEALEVKQFDKCKMNPFESKFNLDDKADQPDDNKVYVPNYYSSEDFLALLEQEKPREYLSSDGVQPSESEEETEVI